MASHLSYATLKAQITLLRTFMRLAVGTLPTSPNSTLLIPSREQGRTIKTHIYSPSKTSDSQTPTPVLLNLHGSGFVLGLHGSDDVFCRYVAANTPYTVIDIQYRLAPEYPFPAAVEDVEDVLDFVLARRESYDISRIAVSGFSAGGCLALVLASGSGRRYEHGTIKKCAAFYPVVDLDRDPSTKLPPETGGTPISPWMARLFNSAYLQGHDARDPRVSPAFADVEEYCDEMVMVTCGYDNLAPEAEELVERLKKVKGEKARCVRLSMENHAWDKDGAGKPGAEERREKGYRDVVEMLNS